MKYIDTGSRQPNQTLGAWLKDVLRPRARIEAIRWQTGFFSGDILDYFEPQLTTMTRRGGLIRVLIGSNDGQTRSADLNRLLAAGGAPRLELQIGVVSYGSGYFHPKTVHITRYDGSQTAYVGSANLTRSGAELHIEAGVVLDTKNGDDPAVLDAIAQAIDDWFGSGRAGLTEVASPVDVSALTKTGAIDRQRPSPPPRPAGVRRRQARLAPLGSAPKANAAPSLRSGRRNPTIAITQVWTKTLSPSDAQRKNTGNQRGSITLVRGPNSIDARTWFRRSFFGDQTWISSTTKTGRPLEKTTIQFNVAVRGCSIGPKMLSVSFDTRRESSQSNYTTLLHLDGLSELFVQQDMSKERLTLARTAIGEFFLSIG